MEKILCPSMMCANYGHLADEEVFDTHIAGEGQRLAVPHVVTLQRTGVGDMSCVEVTGERLILVQGLHIGRGK